MSGCKSFAFPLTKPSGQVLPPPPPYIVISYFALTVDCNTPLYVAGRLLAIRLHRWPSTVVVSLTQYCVFNISAMLRQCVAYLGALLPSMAFWCIVVCIAPYYYIEEGHGTRQLKEKTCCAALHVGHLPFCSPWQSLAWLNEEASPSCWRRFIQLTIGRSEHFSL